MEVKIIVYCFIYEMLLVLVLIYDSRLYLFMIARYQIFASEIIAMKQSMFSFRKKQHHEEQSLFQINF